MEIQIITIIVALLSSGLIQFFFNHFDAKNNKLDRIENKINYVEIGLTRTQLLVMMQNYEERQEEIMKLAYRYFAELKGDFYLTTLFKDFLEKHNIDKPEWFISGNI